MLSAERRPRLIVLGAGTPFAGVRHSALRAVDGESRVLDWVLHAFEPLDPEVWFVGGYQLEDVMARYDRVAYVRNENWRGTGSVGSLALAPLREGIDHFVCYSDIVMRGSLVQRLRDAGDDAIAAAVDGSYPARYRDMPAAEVGRREKARLDGGKVAAAGYELLEGRGVAEFIGLLRIPGALVGRFAAVLASQPPEFARAHLAELAQRLLAAGVAVRAEEARGEWSDLNSARCLARFVLGTKGETLERLQKMVRRSRILPQVRFDVRGWRADAAALSRAAVGAFSGRRLAVRSSALSEDGFESANAGAYTSVLDVACRENAVAEAVEKVIGSFAGGSGEDQVLIQPMVERVALSGVALTRRLSTGAPYYTINYNEGEDTSAVTSGNHAALETAVVFRGRRSVPAQTPRALQGVLDALVEVEGLLHYDSLDVEFAVDQAGEPTLLQVRPLVVGSDRSAEDDARVADALRVAAERFAALMPPPAGVVGERALWGSMPDWNPAEIIGVRPRPLASSLYFHLITNETWARQRAEYGYRDLRPVPLIRLFAGQPYVDVRASVNSFVPASLPAADAARLVDRCIENLSAHPELHDKLEFEVIPTCFDLDFARWRERLWGAGGIDATAFAKLADGLRAVTAAGLQRMTSDLASVDAFAARAALLGGGRGTGLESAVALIEDCRAGGTLPFAHLARAAFIAVTLLNSAVRRGLVSAERRGEFLESLETVSKEFRRDARRVREGAMSLEMLVARYGHLRPGTYEITSERYAAEPGRYLRPSVERAEEEPQRAFAWTRAEREALDAAFSQAGLPLDATSFERFARAAIAGRESSKFVFTRHLSEALELIAAYGASLGLDRDEMSHLAYSDLRALALGTVAGSEAAAFVRRRAAEAREWMRVVENVELPPLLRSSEDFFSFRYPRTVPNFVTTKRVTARAASGPALAAGIRGAIALIPQADPGYDWLFGQGIAGLITMFGGANSHMAIRAAELGLPAAIGVGEPRFEDLCRATVVHLDCGAKQITVAG